MTRRRQALTRIAADQVRDFVALHRLPPSYLQLAAILHCSERTARRRVEDAETLGLLVWSRGPWPVELGAA